MQSLWELCIRLKFSVNINSFLKKKILERGAKSRFSTRPERKGLPARRGSSFRKQEEGGIGGYGQILLWAVGRKLRVHIRWSQCFLYDAEGEGGLPGERGPMEKCSKWWNFGEVPERSAGRSRPGAESSFFLPPRFVLQPKAKPWASGLEASLDRLLGVPLRDQQRAPKHHQRPPAPISQFSLFQVSLIPGVKHSFLRQSYLKDNKLFDIAQRNTFEEKEFRDFPGGPVVKTLHFSWRECWLGN